MQKDVSVLLLVRLQLAVRVSIFTLQYRALAFLVVCLPASKSLGLEGSQALLQRQVCPFRNLFVCLPLKGSYK